MKSYNKRTWLNPTDSHYTGSIVCHDNIVINQGKPAERYTFVEISSCHTKLKLHPDANDGEFKTAMFVRKLHLLSRELLELAEHLLQTPDIGAADE